MSLHTQKNSIRTCTAAVLGAAVVTGLTAPAGAQCNDWEAMPFVYNGTWDMDPFAVAHFQGQIYASGWSQPLLRLGNSEWHVVGPMDAITFLVHDGELYAGGTGGARRTVGGNDTQWEKFGQTSGSDIIYTKIEFEGDLIVGGGFNSIDGVAVNNVARWDGSQWHPMGNGLGDGGFNTAVWDFTIWNGWLVAVGAFTDSGGQPVHKVAVWENNSWNPVGTGLIEGDVVRAVEVYKGQLVIGGRFTHAGGVPVNNLARYTGTPAWEPMLGGVGMGSHGNHSGVWDIEHFGNDLIVVGAFNSVNGDPNMKCIARWSDDPAAYGWHSMGIIQSLVRTALVAEDWLMISGAISPINGDLLKKRVSRWRPAPPSFLEHPESLQIVDEGEQVTFTASLGGLANSYWSYEWRRDGVPLAAANNGNATGYDSPMLTLTDVTEDDLGVYQLRAFTSCGVSESSAATLIVTPGPTMPSCPGDLNLDGAVNVSDLLLLLSNWGICP
ncbi:MAG: hypothetical protein EA377_02430 [Phycisphaerales bacterium]|nr:MAG: hypothetical protein EA377_02430 [Phycisphaerales bacterium]